MSCRATPPEAAAGVTDARLPGGWFIYYRIRPDDLPALRQAWCQHRDRCLQGHPHVQARLLQRQDTQGELMTMMETYLLPPALPAPDRAALRLAIDDWASAPERSIWWQGARHWEEFEPCA